MRKLTTSLLGLALLSSMSVAKQSKDIVDTAIGAGQFTTLVKLVGEANLVETLRGNGPFTVFAPTDKAFAKLPKSTVQALLRDRKLLTQVLTYHVIAGKVLSTDLKDGLKAKTVQGSTIMVDINGSNVRFNNAGLVKADIGATNGVIHVIDTVLVPESVAKMLKKTRKH